MQIILNILRSFMLIGLFCAPASVSLSALLKVGGGLTILTSKWRQHWREIVRWPVFWGVMVVIGWMLFNMIGSAASTHYQHKIFLHYAAFLPLCFIAAPLFENKFWRLAVINTLILSSFLIAINYFLVDHGVWQHISAGMQAKASKVAFGKLQEQSVLLALGVYLSLLQLAFTFLKTRDDKYLVWQRADKKTTSSVFYVVFLIVAMLSILYVLLQVQHERVGVVVCAFLLFVLPLQIFRFKTALKCLAVMMLLVALTFSLSSGVREKFSRAYNNYLLYHHNSQLNSIGLRISGIKKSLNLWHTKPLAGYGTGAFSGGSDANMSSDMGMTVENNYISLLAQHGIIGLLLWLLMLISMWLQLRSYPILEKTVGRGVLMAVALAANSYPAFLVNNSMVWLVVVLASCYGAGLIYKSKK